MHSEHIHETGKEAKSVALLWRTECDSADEWRGSGAWQEANLVEFPPSRQIDEDDYPISSSYAAMTELCGEALPTFQAALREERGATAGNISH